MGAAAAAGACRVSAELLPSSPGLLQLAHACESAISACTWLGLGSGLGLGLGSGLGLGLGLGLELGLG